MRGFWVALLRWMACALVACSAAADVLIVDLYSGPGADHVQIRDAVLAAQEGDVVELGLQVRQIGSTGAVAARIARLGHEAINDAVELQSVIETLVGQSADAFDMVRRLVGQQFNDHLAVFLPASAETRPITATLVRQVALMGGDASLFVPEAVAEALKTKLSEKS